MLLQFEVNNFCSIKDTATFNLQSTQKEGHSFQVRNYNLLQSAVIYGANASGKSNLIKAMQTMSSLILNHDRVSLSTDNLNHQPFLLNSETETASTTFEIIFILNETIYRYGFEYDSRTIYAEWLFSDEKGKEAKLFYRDIDDEFYVNPTRFREGKGLESRTLKNHLFLWKCDSENGLISQQVMAWFTKFNMIDGLNNRAYLEYTNTQLRDKSFKEDILKLLKVADLGIFNIDRQKSIVNREVETLTLHQKFDKDNSLIGEVAFDFKKHESLGTQKFFAISAPILDTLKHGKVLIIDELDASLHPMLTIHLIKMFHDKHINKKNAQLIFTTHDTNLLQNSLLGRDQVWFTQKDKYGSTEVYSLLEYRENRTRKDTNKEKYYLQGRYGAIPYLGEFDFEDLADES